MQVELNDRRKGAPRRRETGDWEGAPTHHEAILDEVHRTILIALRESVRYV